PPAPPDFHFSLHDALPIFQIGHGDIVAAFARMRVSCRLPCPHSGECGYGFRALMVAGFPHILSSSSLAWLAPACGEQARRLNMIDRKSTRLNSSHVAISYA